MALIVPSWSPSWSLPPPMRAAATDPRTGDAAPAPSECLSEAHYRLLRHAAVHTLSLLGHASAVFKKRCFTRHRRRRSRGRWFPNEGRPGSRADSAPGERFSVPRCRLLHHTAVSFASSDIRPPASPLWALALRLAPRASGDGILVPQRPPAFGYINRHVRHDHHLPGTSEDVNVNTVLMDCFTRVRTGCCSATLMDTYATIAMIQSLSEDVNIEPMMLPRLGAWV